MYVQQSFVKSFVYNKIFFFADKLTQPVYNSKLANCMVSPFLSHSQKKRNFINYKEVSESFSSFMVFNFLLLFHINRRFTMIRHGVLTG